MTVSRALLVLLMMVGIGVSTVLLRHESAKASNRIQKLHHRKIVMEQKLWARQLDLAKLRGPEQIRQRANEMGLEVMPPADTEEPAKPAKGTNSGKPSQRSNLRD